jgi:hypothetical protein
MQQNPRTVKRLFIAVPPVPVPFPKLISKVRRDYRVAWRECQISFGIEVALFLGHNVSIHAAMAIEPSSVDYALET